VLQALLPALTVTGQAKAKDEIDQGDEKIGFDFVGAPVGVTRQGQ
jgi:hypothetical protein